MPEYELTVKEELTYIGMWAPEDREFLAEFEDPSYDWDGVCLEQLFDDVPY